MSTTSTIWNHTSAAVSPLTPQKSGRAATAADGGTSTTASGTSGDQATISANDFLTLLVAEMKNQDPTAQNDPNAYINQLVQVNSLEQLIQINGSLSSALGTTASGATAHALPGRVAASPDLGTPANSSAPASAPSAPPAGIGQPASLNSAPFRTAAGNLSAPDPMPAAQRVAQALSGRP